jgi:hypothetical protein
MVGDGPLSGYRIIDVTAMISGPLATQILADQGADVIKIENPAGGDHTRASPNRRGGLAAAFLNNNRNKRSVAIDLKQERGRAVLMRLVAGADVFVQNFRPGVADRMGLGEEVVRRAAPRIVYASISGFGAKGPMASKPAGLNGTNRPFLVIALAADMSDMVITSTAMRPASASCWKRRITFCPPVRNSSTLMPYFCSKVLAMCWAAATGVDVYQVSAPSRRAAASSTGSGLNSCASAGVAARAAAITVAPINVLTKAVMAILPLPVCLRCC